MSNVLSTSIATASGTAAPVLSNQLSHATSSADVAAQTAQAVAAGDPAVVVALSNAAGSVKEPSSYGKSRRTDRSRGTSGDDRGGKEKVSKDDGRNSKKTIDTEG